MVLGPGDGSEARPDAALALQTLAARNLPELVRLIGRPWEHHQVLLVFISSNCLGTKIGETEMGHFQRKKQSEAKLNKPNTNNNRCFYLSLFKK